MADLEILKAERDDLSHKLNAAKRALADAAIARSGLHPGDIVVKNGKRATITRFTYDHMLDEIVVTARVNAADDTPGDTDVHWINPQTVPR